MARGGSNAIGSASVILSANADGLAAGMDKAAKKLDGFGDRVKKSLDKSAKQADKGGFLSGKGSAVNGAVGAVGALLGGQIGGVLGGIAQGGGAGLALGGPVGALIGAGLGAAIKSAEGLSAAVGQALGLLERVPAIVNRLREGPVSGGDWWKLTGISAAFDNIERAGDRLLTRFITPLAPFFARTSEIVVSLLDRWGPRIEKVADALNAVLFVGAEIGGAFLDGIGQVIDGIERWASAELKLGDTNQSVGHQVIDALHKVADAVATVWDTWGKGVAVVGVVAAAHLSAVGAMIQAQGKLYKAIRPPDWAIMLGGIGPQLLAAATHNYQDLDEIGGGLMKAGQALHKASVDALMAPPGAAQSWVDQLFAGIRTRFDKIQMPQKFELPKLAGVAQQGSTDAYSIIVKNKLAGAAGDSDVMREQLKQARETNGHLKDIKAGLGGGAVKIYDPIIR
jgi:hypothetical protein